METVGTPLFQAPELMRRERYDEKVDMWSFACVLECLWTHRMVFEAAEESGEIDQGSEGLLRLVEDEKLQPKADGFLAEVVQECAAFDPSQRATFSRVIELLTAPVTLEQAARLPPGPPPEAGSDIAPSMLPVPMRARDTAAVQQAKPMATTFSRFETGQGAGSSSLASSCSSDEEEECETATADAAEARVTVPDAAMQERLPRRKTLPGPSMSLAMQHKGDSAESLSSLDSVLEDDEEDEDSVDLARHYNAPENQPFAAAGVVQSPFDGGVQPDAQPADESNVPRPFAEGARVRHVIRGLGMVMELMEDGRARVRFDSGEEHRYKPASMHKLSSATKMGDAAAVGDAATRLRERARLRRAAREGRPGEGSPDDPRRPSRADVEDDLHGWHEDSTPMPRAGPGREHVRESSRRRHVEHQRTLAAAQQQRNRETARVAIGFVSKLRRASRGGGGGGEGGGGGGGGSGGGCSGEAADARSSRSADDLAPATVHV